MTVRDTGWHRNGSRRGGSCGGRKRPGFPEFVGERLLVGAVGAHLMRLINDDQVPMAAEEALLGIVDSRHRGNRRHGLVLLLPGIGTVVGAQYVAANDFELLLEL